MFSANDSGIFLWLLLAYLSTGIGVVQMILGKWREWYDSSKKAPLSPPNWVFSIVWPILDTLWGFGTWIAWKELDDASSYVVWILHWIFALLVVVFKATWVPLFFGFAMPQLALLVLIVTLPLVVAQCVLAFFVSLVAGGLLVPLSVWLLYALYLNVYFVMANDVVVEKNSRGVELESLTA